MFRRVIKIRAEDSPNVRLALIQQSMGIEPTGEILVPGVIDWFEYKKRRSIWDKQRQCVGLDAEFYEGSGALLYPLESLNAAAQRARDIRGQKRQATGIGVDSGEGRANTSMAAVDAYGLLDLVSRKTPNTAVIPSDVLEFARRHGVPMSRVYFDTGGGGKQHADHLRAQGHKCRAISFGEPVAPDPRHGVKTLEERRQGREGRYAYFNRRAQMYHALALLLAPFEGEAIFALPDEGEAYEELRRQMAAIPKQLGDWSMYDQNGRIRMLPKNRRAPNSNETCLTDLIGHSPDELDAVVLAVYARDNKAGKVIAGGF